jgi:hypothetical protein
MGRIPVVAKMVIIEQNDWQLAATQHKAVGGGFVGSQRRFHLTSAVV